MSYTDILIEPERSAILTERISWPSLVFVGRLISKTMNITLRSFIPGFKLRMSVNSPMVKNLNVYKITEVILNSENQSLNFEKSGDTVRI